MFQVLLPTHESYILPTIMMSVRALERKGLPLVKSPLRSYTARGLAKILGALHIRRLPFIMDKEPVFIQLNHAWKNAFYPYVLRHPLVTYTFDCWPYLYDEWEDVFRLNKPRIAFISAKESTLEMQRRVPNVDFRWLPEAGDPAGYNGSLLLRERPIDLLELGRAYPDYHDAIREPLTAAKYRHQFPLATTGILLPYHKAIEAYSLAKIVVCFPKSVTDPRRAGNVETTTFRYFESIFSKCILIGHCPAELREVMGYNPVVEVDMERPASQLIEDVLCRVQDFQPLVEKNYDVLVKKMDRRSPGRNHLGSAE